jgi:branched-chain amino acid transport system ATP-binding protein
MLEVNNLNVYYGEFKALNEITFDVNKNETVALAGPNGHGKSTALKAIAGLAQIRGGQIVFQGNRIERKSTVEIVKMGIILVPEGGHLFPEMTVLENLLMGAYNPEAWEKRYDNLRKVFEFFPLLEKIQNRLCIKCSGGEKRCIAVGRGLMSSAKILMLDEPTLGLAPLLAKKLMETIHEISNSGVTIILVEENIRYISELADRVFLVHKGKVIFEGKPEELLQNKLLKETYLGL